MTKVFINKAGFKTLLYQILTYRKCSVALKMIAMMIYTNLKKDKDTVKL